MISQKGLFLVFLVFLTKIRPKGTTKIDVVFNVHLCKTSFSDDLYNALSLNQQIGPKQHTCFCSILGYVLLKRVTPLKQAKKACFGA